jgi:hypothetical protein
MDLWSVFHRSALFTPSLASHTTRMPLVNHKNTRYLMRSHYKQGSSTTCEITRHPNMLEFHFIIQVILLTYTTQANISNLNTCAYASKHMKNAHPNATIKSMGLLPLLVCSNLIDPTPFQWHYHVSLPSLWLFSPPLSTISKKGAMGRDSQVVVQRGINVGTITFYGSI